MIRRRRTPREIPFSFDSFLDVVANVVGIIIRLILVVWVGARSYSSVQELAKPGKQSAETVAAVQEADDPMRHELDRHRQELAAAQSRLLEQLRRLADVQGEHRQAEDKLGALRAREQGLDQEQIGLARAREGEEKAGRFAALSLAEIRQRHEHLVQDIRALEKLPPVKKVLRYRTPVSEPVHTEEFFFECRQGRVSFIDIATMLAEVRNTMEEKSKELRTQWQVSDVTLPAGAFRLRYTVERERGVLDSALALGPEGGAFHYSLSEWVVEPVQPTRGETMEQALANGAQFRRLADTLDARSVVTFWVYPDSFAIYRRLRDYLYDRDVSVAGRPLMEGVPIVCSRHGSASRAQ